MTQPSPMTDRTALAHARDRARRAPAYFLQEDAAAEVKERLNEVNRTFTRVAVVTPFSKIWARLMPGATLVPDDDVLALAPDAYDLVIHALCLHWSNDPVGQMIQCRRALVPDGLFLATLFGGQTLHELRAALAEAEVAHSGGLSPRIAPMGALHDLGALLQRAGFALPVADTTRRTVTYRDMHALLHDLRAMGETNVLNARRKNIPPRAMFRNAAARYVARWGDEKGRIPALFETIFLTGWAPADSQPKPLRPGSANQRLADALLTKEVALPDKAPHPPD
ncbi:MAG: SAM-dependent methyltransferase [Halocynthiibacter sp.]